MLTLDQFRAKYNGKGIDYDGAFGNQCVDLMNQYLVEVLGISNPIQVLPGDTAANIYKNYNGTQFDKIANTPTGVPQAGDIVAVFVQGDVNSFRSFDQNFPTGSLCHDQNHPDYSNVLGWLRKKPQSTTEPMATITQKELDALRAARDQNYNDLQIAKAKYDKLKQAVSTALLNN